MDSLSKTSFVPQPKGNLAGSSSGLSYNYKEAGGGLLFKTAVFLLIVSLIALGATLFYKKLLTKQIDQLSLSLKRANSSFDAALIKEMDDLSQTIPVVKTLLEEHYYPSNIFELLQSLTLKEIRFTKFDYAFVKQKESSSRLAPAGQQTAQNVQNTITVSLEGEAKNYSALAAQAEVLSKSEYIKSFSFSNFSLTKEGNVSFSLDLVLDMSIFKNFKQP